ncbi:hypothetical protein Vretimale_12095 [Volvox reticuliferus]|nr:hypothetical protein Vretifemale_9521 [Volvox reticuliferus]GIM08079.1 hypothetical protein Vretimale_12095 [Volvox reticuliferus]
MAGNVHNTHALLPLKWKDKNKAIQKHIILMNLLNIQRIFLLVLLAHFSQASDDSSEQSGFFVREAAQRPFLALKDPIHESSENIQQFNEQASNASAIAYHLFGAAEALSQAQGSSNALLPSLTPTILRLYLSQPQRATSALFKQLYELSWSLYGPPPFPQACYYHMYISLRSTFSWVRDNIVLKLQEVPGQPLASAMWPDMTKYPAQKLTAVVADALTDQAKLGETAMLITGGCGMAVKDFAALVPNISAALKELHADLHLLQDVGSKMYKAHYQAEQSTGISWLLNNPLSSRRQALATTASQHSVSPDVDTREGRRLTQSGVSRTASFKDNNDAKQHADDSSYSDRLHSRGRLLQTTVNSMPPNTFSPAAPSTKPALLVPLVFHVMLYNDYTNGGIGPAQHDQAPAFIDRLIWQLNLMSKPTNIQFFVKEVRNSADSYPNLLLPSRSSWLNTPFCSNSLLGGCLQDLNFTSSLVSDWPRSINVFVASESYMASGILGYAFVPS